MSENTSDKNVPELRTRKFINFRVVPLKIFPVLSNHLTTVYIYYSSCDLTTLLHIHELQKSFSTRQRSPDPGTNRSESVRDFQNFVGPGPVQDFRIVLGSGPIRSGTNRFLSVDPCRYVLMTSIEHFRTKIASGHFLSE